MTTLILEDIGLREQNEALRARLDELADQGQLLIVERDTVRAQIAEALRLINSATDPFYAIAAFAPVNLRADVQEAITKIAEAREVLSATSIGKANV